MSSDITREVSTNFFAGPFLFQIPPPVIDNLGRTVSAPFVDPWEARQGIGLALEKIAPHVPEDQVCVWSIVVF